ncbi:DotD/TraH family lipoprotein [uncultured Roseobacter sp.]|uniref:DotD/TraH family lipoprotein n=1 Tax=uncultured Roseobacter sp. TaxID=114847 RepID=UPI002637F1EC|nr:DotD/TraH family lipoprotein [uncultured Roseobacter sp.]
MRLAQTILVTLGVLSCAACTATKLPATTSLSALIDAETSAVDREIADAGLYSGVLEPYATGNTTLKNPDYVTDERLMNVVHSQFTGPIEDFVSKMALETGYRVIAQGEKPGAPILITLVQRDLPAMGALREAFFQGKDRAALEVDQRTKTMTIVYKRPERSPVPHIEDTEV